jgi:hypothetical protein
VGAHLTRALAEHFAARGRSYVDLSVLHDNRKAIDLYERVGFVRVPVLSLKRKNTINERLFVTPPSESYRGSTRTPGSSPTRPGGAASASRCWTRSGASSGCRTRGAAS